MPIYDGSTIEEAIANGLEALQLKKDQVEIKVVAEPKKGILGIGKKLAKVSIEALAVAPESEVVEPDITSESESVPVESTVAEIPVEVDSEELSDELALAKLAVYLEDITRELQAPAKVSYEQTDRLITFQLETEKQGILIGKHGKMLNAFQYLAQVFIHRVAKNKLTVVVNVGDYREKRQAALTRLANRTAEKVKHTGQPVFLEPMPAFERKLIHSVLSEDEYIKTHSEGDEPYRYLVVESAKKYF